jgi:hypothetical protein
MRSERGQATVEWIGLVLVVALVLGTLTHRAPTRGNRDLGVTLAHAITDPAKRSHARASPPGETLPPSSSPGSSPSPVAAVPTARVGQRSRRQPSRRGGSVGLTRKIPPSALPDLPKSLRRARRGAGALWKRAWFACLVYERTRYALLHPESRFPGYTLPFDAALRMVNNCVSPVDLLSDWPALDGDR